MKDIQFQQLAYTDAAGKADPAAPRSGNEDNFLILELGKNELLMCVADGMGGMNAGEVASQVAVDTVKEEFDKIDPSARRTWTEPQRKAFMEKVIRKADSNVKFEAKKDASRSGMGSTIIMAWLCGTELTISWCGDSRAYVFSQNTGLLRLLSCDHSYVQSLVNKGVLTYDQTFNHPQNNIIMRSLGDPNGTARPESRTAQVGKGDIIMLCSDGLSGVLRDRPGYPEENIEDIMRANTHSLTDMRQALWAAAERMGWYDNVTVTLCAITDGPPSPKLPLAAGGGSHGAGRGRRWVWIGLAALALCALLAGAFFAGRMTTSEQHEDKQAEAVDSVTNDVEDTIETAPTTTPAADTLPKASKSDDKQKEPRKEQKTKERRKDKPAPAPAPAEPKQVSDMVKEQAAEQNTDSASAKKPLNEIMKGKPTSPMLKSPEKKDVPMNQIEKPEIRL